MLPQHHAPIVAIATAPGRGAVGIVRVSGHDLGALIEALCGRRLEPRRAHFGPFLDDRGEAIDQGLAIHFPAPHSYTGEDVLELQAHGGPVVLQLLVARCLAAAEEPLPGPAGPGATSPSAPQPGVRRSRLPGLRLARPGEFTERAFLNDKLDLAQAEAVADLIDASTEAAARSAGRALEGAFSRDLERLREELVALRVLVEATLDFPEEEIDFLQRADAHGRLARIDAALTAVRQRARQGALLREGLRVVLAGQPNVGKSSLLNALAGAELAIVTPLAGTTRDKVAETIQIDGVPLHVIDTAGLRDESEAGDEAERIGMQRSWGAIETADAVVFLHDLTRRGEPAYEAAERDIAARWPSGLARLDVYNKADAAPAGCLAEGALALSARTGEGLDALRARLLELAGWQPGSEGVFIARARHLQALQLTAEAVDEARRLAAQGDGALELLAEELRRAHEALGQITGTTTPDDLLGEIFGRFCIGK
jgi:tRNA modification GTPase